MRTPFLTALALLSLPATTMAAGKVKCDSCESCTQAAAKPGSRVVVEADLPLAGGTCITITGEGVELNGQDHRFTASGSPAGIAVAVKAKAAFVHRLNIEAADVGVLVEAPQATLLKINASDSQVGVQARNAPDVRVRRSTFERGRIGISLGEPPSGAECAAGQVTNPGAVIQRNTIKETEIGVAACEALPVLTDNTFTGNVVGLLLGNPKPGKGVAGKAPYDSCICGPELPKMTPGTAIFYSSGCGGCKVHEGWLPQIEQAGHKNLLVRRTGAEVAQETAVFDRYVRRCAPDISDAIGTPGCVPNYACLANDTVFKRVEGGRLVRDHQLNDANAVGQFAANCEAAAKASKFGKGARCLPAALARNTLCGSLEADIKGAPKAMSGQDNSCDKAVGWRDQGAKGCAQACSVR